MNQKLQLALSLGAGLFGGFAAHYTSPGPVHAQVRTLLPKEIRAQAFILVNDAGNPAGIFGFDENSNPNIELLDKSGKVIWSANGKAQAKPLAIATPK